MMIWPPLQAEAKRSPSGDHAVTRTQWRCPKFWKDKSLGSGIGKTYLLSTDKECLLTMNKY